MQVRTSSGPSRSFHHSPAGFAARLDRWNLARAISFVTKSEQKHTILRYQLLSSVCWAAIFGGRKRAAFTAQHLRGIDRHRLPRTAKSDRRHRIWPPQRF